MVVIARTLRRARWGLTVVALVALGAGCSPLGAAPARDVPSREIIVGMPIDVPPYSWLQDGSPTGMEVDFASRLASALGTRAQIRTFPFERLLRALSAGEVDIAMGGISVTPARQAEIAFSEPYLRGGLLSVVRREDQRRYDTVDKVMAASDIGVVVGTTGAAFVKARVDTYRVHEYPRTREAMNELVQRRVDVVVHDAPVLVWYASRNESEVAVVPTFLAREDLAWGMRPDATGLRDEVNGVLAKWRADGTLAAVIDRWLPYWSKIRER